jgi:ferritin-like metal-binding protein YciE
MAIASLKDLYFDELGDLYDAETQMIRTLPRLVEAARAPELRETLKRHCDESRLHLERLELIFTHWGERRRAKPCAGIAGIVQEADERLNDAATDDVRDAAIIGVAQRIEHYEIAAYGCARTYARRLNRLDEARLLQETLEEEGRTDRRLTELAEGRINDDARQERDFRAPQARRLTYVSLDDVVRQRGSAEPVPIWTSTNDNLGTLDGLVVDVDGHARYVVVDAGGILHRRHLLPVGLLRVDERGRVLRARVDKDIAARYPAFDADEFNTMTEGDRGRYEARVLTFFPRDDARESPDADAAIGSLPEWLLTGTWITVPPGCADRLPDDAHEFVNEFAPVPAESVEAPPGCERMVAQEREPPMRRQPEASPAAPDREKTR